MTEMLKTSETTEKLLKFIDASPSCFHAVKNICVMLEDAGCIRLLENETWTLEKGKRYFTTRNGSSVLAFSVPENYNGMQIVSAHSDSPTFRVKSGAEITVEGHYKKLNTEGYGGMILSTWFDRPLSLAGRAVVRTESGVRSVLLNIDRDLCIIPSLAIHMTRGMADHKLNPQVDLLPLLGGENADYNALIAEEAGVKKEDVISSDMFLYPRQHGVVFGMENEFIASPRLDDLQCAFSATEAFLNAENKEKLLISAVFDNEEVGSLTKQGADSTFLTATQHSIDMPESEAASGRNAGKTPSAPSEENGMSRIETAFSVLCIPKFGGNISPSARRSATMAGVPEKGSVSVSPVSIFAGSVTVLPCRVMVSFAKNTSGSFLRNRRSKPYSMP